MGTLRRYASLMQFKIVSLLAFSTIAGFAIARPYGALLLKSLVLATIGVILASAGAEVMNKLLERDIDRKMERTRRRPSVRGLIGVRAGLLLGLGLVGTGIVLGYLVNQLAALMILSGAVFYILVYTLILKRRSRFSVLIGGFAGSFCVWTGVAAAAGTITVPGLILGLLVLLWIPGHIWSLALRHRDDYRRAGVPMFTAVESERTGTLTIALFNVLMALVTISLVPFLGIYYAAIIVIPLLLVLYLSVKVVLDSSKVWSVFKLSSPYLAFVFIAVIVATFA